MKRTKFIFIAALSAACGSSASPGAPAPPPPTFELTGLVTEVRAAVRRPARNVAVEISPTYRTVTDSDGSFSIRGLAEGTYVLRVSDLLYEPLSTTIRIEGDTRIDLEIAPRPVYALSGIVYEDTENGPIPLSGVLVNNSEIHSSATTDATGAYRVFALRGSALITFTKDGYVSQGRDVAMESDVLLDVKLVRR
jgi:hypothetical protein